MPSWARVTVRISSWLCSAVSGSSVIILQRGSRSSTATSTLSPIRSRRADEPVLGEALAAVEIEVEVGAKAPLVDGDARPPRRAARRSAARTARAGGSRSARGRSAAASAGPGAGCARRAVRNRAGSSIAEHLARRAARRRAPDPRHRHRWSSRPAPAPRLRPGWAGGPPGPGTRKRGRHSSSSSCSRPVR